MANEVKLSDGARKDIRRDAERNCEGATVADTLRLLDDYDALHAETEARLDREQIALAHAMEAASEAERLRSQLEAARGLLRDMRHATRVRPSCQTGIVSPCRCMSCVDARTDAFLTATPEPEGPDHMEDHLEMVEKVERQEAVAYAVHAKGMQVDHHCPLVSPEMAADYLPGCVTALYTSPPPAQGVSGLVEALKEAAAELEDWRMSFPDANATVTDGLLVRIDNLISTHRNPATVKRCQTCTGTCAEICAKARP